MISDCCRQSFQTSKAAEARWSDKKVWETLDHGNGSVIDGDAETVYEGFETFQSDVEDRLKLAIHSDPVDCQTLLHRLFDGLYHPFRVCILPRGSRRRYGPLSRSCCPENVVHLGTDEWGVVVAGVGFTYAV